MKVLPGNQFPVEGYDNFTKQVVPRSTTTDPAIIAVYTALVDKVCPCAVLVHSQAGQFGLKVAQARPDKVKALILVEPAGVGDAATVKTVGGAPEVIGLPKVGVRGNSHMMTNDRNNLEVSAVILPACRHAADGPDTSRLRRCRRFANIRPSVKPTLRGKAQ